MDRHRGNEDFPDGAIDSTRAAFVAALEHGDAEGAASVYAPDARLLPPSAELLQGRDAIRAFWRAGLDAGLREIKHEVLNLERGDGRVYEIGRYDLILKPAGGTVVADHGKYVLIHEPRDDGSWQRAVEMFSPDSPPVAMSPSRAAVPDRQHGLSEEGAEEIR